MSKRTTPTDKPTTEPLALRPKAAAAALGIGQRKLWELTNQGKIPHLKIGRATLYPVRELVDWLTEQAKGGGR